MNINNMSVSDLYSLYLFVKEDYNKVAFGKDKNNYPRSFVGFRLKMIEDELCLRAYGYSLGEEPTQSIKGEKPEDIDLSKYDGED